MNDMCDNQWLFEFDKSFLHVIKQCWYDQAKQDLHHIPDDSVKYRLLKYVICNVELEFCFSIDREVYRLVVMLDQGSRCLNWYYQIDKYGF